MSANSIVDADLSVIVTVSMKPHLQGEFTLTEPFRGDERKRYPQAYIDETIKRALKETEAGLRQTFAQLNDRCAPETPEFEWRES
jgi:hypothetical protein